MIDPNDLLIDVYQKVPAQHINTIKPYVKVTHIPTGIVVDVDDELSQMRAKAKAIAQLEDILSTHQPQG